MQNKINKHAERSATLLFASVFFLFTPFSALKRASAETKWEKISSYTTYFNAEDRGRCENIAIAAELISGITVQPYGEFSFNQTVGKRTEEAGFQQAKIIVNGEYVLGTGGGVCQVSTTLYNAALKSGLTVTEFHPHSLQVSYVPPSRDAMVSTQSDLCFINPHSFPVTCKFLTELNFHYQNFLSATLYSAIPAI